MRILNVVGALNARVCRIADLAIGLYRMMEDLDAMAMRSLAMLLGGPWSN